MKKLLLFLCLGLLFTACMQEAALKVATFNIRYENQGDASRTDTYRKSLDLDETYRVGDFPAEVSFERHIAKTPSDHFPVFIKVRLQ